MGCNLSCTEDDQQKIEESIQQGREDQDFQVDKNFIQENKAAVEAKIEEKVERLLEPKEERPREEKVSQLPKECKVSGLPPKIPIQGFNTSGVITDEEIKEFCAQSPIHHKSSSLFTSAEYSGERKKGEPLGECISDPKTGKYDMIVRKPRLEDIPECIKHLPESANKIEKELVKEFFQDRFKEEMKITFAHEEADAYYKESMSKEGKDRWDEVCVKSRERGEGYITPYASTNPKEDFAECAGYFEIDPKHLKEECETKYNFIKEHYSSLKKNLEKDKK